MAGMTQANEIAITGILDRQFGKDRNAVIALLPARNHVGIPKRRKPFGRDLVDRRLAFLQA